MSSIGHHLVRRAFDATQDHFSSSTGFRGIDPADEPQGQDEARIKQLAVWGIAVVYMTGILYMAIMSAVSRFFFRPIGILQGTKLTASLRSPIPTAMS